MGPRTAPDEDLAMGRAALDEELADELVLATDGNGVEHTVKMLCTRSVEVLRSGDEAAREALLAKARSFIGRDNVAVGAPERARCEALIANSEAVYLMLRGRARFAQQRLEHALALDLRHGTDESLAATCLNICTVLSHLEQHERALKFAESATLLTGGDDAGDDDCEDLDEYEEGFDARGGCGGGDNPGLSAAAHFNLGVQQEALSRLGLAKLADAIQSYDRARALTELSVQADQQRLAADAGQIEPGRAAATAALARRATSAVASLAKISAEQQARSSLRQLRRASNQPNVVNAVPVDSKRRDLSKLASDRIRTFERSYTQLPPIKRRPATQRKQHATASSPSGAWRSIALSPDQAVGGRAPYQSPQRPQGGKRDGFRRRRGSKDSPVPGLTIATGPNGSSYADADQEGLAELLLSADEDEYLRRKEDELNSFTPVPLHDFPCAPGCFMSGQREDQCEDD